MKDLFGVPLSVGDRVVYTLGSQSHSSLEKGTILAIQDGRAAIASSSGRKLQKSRRSHELMAVKPVAVLHPELFI